MQWHCKIAGLVSNWLTSWGRVTHICVGTTTIIGSDNGLSPGRRQAIIWTNTGILLIWPLGTNLSEKFLFTKMRLKVSSAKWRPSCLGLNELSIPTLGFASPHAFRCTQGDAHPTTIALENGRGFSLINENVHWKSNVDLYPTNWFLHA